MGEHRPMPAEPGFSLRKTGKVPVGRQKRPVRAKSRLPAGQVTLTNRHSVLAFCERSVALPSPSAVVRPALRTGWRGGAGRMTEIETRPAHRILIVDDEPVVHLTIEQALSAPESQPSRYEIVGVDNGPAALKAVQLARRDRRPFSVAYVDLQLESTWDGLKTLQHLWEVDGDLQAVLCTADSQAARRGLDRLESRHDQILFLEKPFGSLDVTQFARALTSRWDLQRQMREYANELERRVEERTAEIRLSQERLQQANAALTVARDQADAANRAKSAFLANMSHEIRTPMSAVLGFIDILDDDDDSSPAERDSCIETIRSNARHLLALINDILDLSRVEAGQVSVERQPFRPRTAAGHHRTAAAPCGREKPDAESAR